MTHDEIQDLLECYVDETLDRDTRRLVDDHLADCSECRAVLDGVEPVELGGLGATFDEAAMRRAVRRSLFRTAVDAALLLVAAGLVVVLVSLLVLQPLAVNRGGRAAEVNRAVIDLATMINPGAVVTGGMIRSGLLSRQLSVEVELPVGSSTIELGPLEARLGLFGVEDPEGGPIRGFLQPEGYETSPSEQLPRLEGTVATVLVRYDQPLAVDAAQQLADAAAQDVRVVWAGFRVASIDGGEPPPIWTAGGDLGYATCTQPLETSTELLSATSASFGGTPLGRPASIEGALSQTRQGLDHLAASPETRSAVPGEGIPDDELEEARSRLQDPAVGSLVLTGPSEELAAYLTDPGTPAHQARTLAVDFYDWTTPVCGR